MSVNPKLLEYCKTPRQREAVEAVVRHGNREDAAAELGINVRALYKHLESVKRRAARHGVGEDPTEHHTTPLPEIAQLKDENHRLRVQLRSMEKAVARDSKLSGFLERLDEAQSSPPDWTFKPRGKASLHGTPTLFLSDLHWGEVVNGPEVNNVNEYGLQIAHDRLRKVVQTTLHLLYEVYSSPDYPGIVVPLGGDMLSGNIHDELRQSNEVRLLPAVMDLVDHLEASLRMLREHLPRVFAPVVVGNHGRLDRNKTFKGGVEDNVDWLVGRLLAERFQNDDSVSIAVSPSFDYYYRVHNHRYLLTHGDSMRGGSGIAGPVTPWALGDHKRRKRQQAIDQPYDTMIFGHWHTLAWGIGGSYICNGSLKGYDEFAFKHSFPYEPPQQALWMTHPRYGITSLWGVRADDPPKVDESAWVSVLEEAA